MKKQMTLPSLRPEMKKAVLCAWLKEEGESFKAGDVIYEIETDKVVNQIEADEDGVVSKLFAEEGDEVNVGSAVAEYEAK